MTFGQFDSYQPVQPTATSTTWSGLQAVDARCYGCIHSYVMNGTLRCGHASRTVAIKPYGQECVSFVPKIKTDSPAEQSARGRRGQMSLNIPNCPECGGDIGGEVVDSFAGLTSWVLDVNEYCSVECQNCGAILNVSVYTIIDVRE